MSGGGGGGSTSSTNYTTSLPPYAEPYYRDLMERAQAESNREYEPYGGKRIAEFSDLQQSALTGARNLPSQYNMSAGRNALSAGVGTVQGARQGANYQNYLQQSQQALGDARGGFDALNTGQGMIQGAYDRTTPDYQARTYSPSQADPYFNQYVSRVLDTQQGRMMDRLAEQKAVRQGEAAKAGAFGGSRAAIQDMVAEREAGRQMNEMEAQLLSQGFDRAHQLGQSAAQFDEGSAARAAQLGLQGAQMGGQMGAQMGQLGTQYGGLGAQIAQGLGNLGAIEQRGESDLFRNQMSQGQTLGQLGTQQIGAETAAQQAGIRDISTQAQMGQQMQQQEQANLDQAYADFVNQRDFGKNQLGWLGGILHGVPVEANSEVIQGGGNQMAQLLGMGLGGYGLYNAIGGGGGMRATVI